MAAFAFAISVFVVTVVSLLGLLFAAFSIYLAYMHWKYSHLPGPERDSFFSGNIPVIRRERERGKIFHEFVQDLHSIHGPIVLLWAYHNPFIFVCDPDIARKCLITLNLPKNPRVYAHLGYPFGQRLGGRGLVAEADHGAWQKRRSLLNPAFHRRYLMNLMSAFNSSCDLFLAKIDEMADGKTVVDMAEEFARVTLDVIGKVMKGKASIRIASPSCPNKERAGRGASRVNPMPETFQGLQKSTPRGKGLNEIFVTSHVKTFLTVSIRRAERTASARLRNG